MSTNFWTEEMTEVHTEEDLGDSVNLLPENEGPEQKSETQYFTPVKMVEETAIYFSLLTIGLVLNSIILRCYWKEKSATSTYFRAFAVFDMLALMIGLAYQVIYIFEIGNPIMTSVSRIMQNLVADLYNFGPLFLALDRIMVVAFPHKFREYEGKMRFGKRCLFFGMVALSLPLSASLIIDPTSIVTRTLRAVVILVVFIQILAIVVLYTAIVMKVMTSDRKMKSSRHVGNK